MTKDALDDYPSKQEILKTIFDAVYAQYPKKEWQGLTDDEEIRKWAEYHGLDSLYETGIIDFARAIEQALKEKNCV